MVCFAETFLFALFLPTFILELPLPTLCFERGSISIVTSSVPCSPQTSLSSWCCTRITAKPPTTSAFLHHTCQAPPSQIIRDPSADTREQSTTNTRPNPLAPEAESILNSRLRISFDPCWEHSGGPRGREHPQPVSWSRDQELPPWGNRNPAGRTSFLIPVWATGWAALTWRAWARSPSQAAAAPERPWLGYSVILGYSSATTQLSSHPFPCAPTAPPYSSKDTIYPLYVLSPHCHQARWGNANILLSERRKISDFTKTRKSFW